MCMYILQLQHTHTNFFDFLELFSKPVCFAAIWKDLCAYSKKIRRFVA